MIPHTPRGDPRRKPRIQIAPAVATTDIGRQPPTADPFVGLGPNAKVPATRLDDRHVRVSVTAAPDSDHTNSADRHTATLVPVDRSTAQRLAVWAVFAAVLTILLTIIAPARLYGHGP